MELKNIRVQVASLTYEFRDIAIDKAIEKFIEAKAEYESQGFTDMSIELGMRGTGLYEDDYPTITLNGTRKETIEEAQRREDRVRLGRERDEQRERAQYEALRSKYGL